MVIFASTHRVREGRCKSQKCLRLSFHMFIVISKRELLMPGGRLRVGLDRGSTRIKRDRIANGVAGGRTVTRFGRNLGTSEGRRNTA